MSRIAFRFLLALLVLIPVLARADIQKSGPEVWPGKIMVGARPLGAQLNFNDGWGYYGNGNGYGVGDRVLYKLALDVAGVIASFSKITLWLGGEFNIGGRGHLALVEPGLFVQITLEKLVTKIPLVPMVRAGFSGPIYIPYGYDNATAAGAFQFKIGGGVYYFLTKNIGLGLDMDWAFGPGFIKVNGKLDTGFSGYWDFTAGARFAF